MISAAIPAAFIFSRYLTHMNALLQARKDLLIPGTLFLITLIVISIAGDSGDFAITVLSFLAVISILVDAPAGVRTPAGGATGRLLMTPIPALMLLAAGYLLLTPPAFARILPFVFLLTVWFIQSGSQVFHRHWKPLVILGLLAIPDRALITPLFYPLLQLFGWDAMTYPTAQFAGWLTTLTGVPATVSQLDIIMEHATVTIWEGCDAVRNMDFLFRLSIILMLTVPIKPRRWVATVLVAVLLGFFVNIVRITLLDHIANYGNMTAFDYWHEGDGSKIFNLIAIIFFAVFAYFQVEQNDSPSRPGDNTSAQPGEPAAEP